MNAASTGMFRAGLAPIAPLALVALVTASAPAAATDGVLLRGAFEAGGDKFGQVEFEGGRSESIKAGGGVHVEGGYRSGFLGPAFESELTLGFKSDSANASNGEFSFSRLTLNAMQYYLVAEQIRLGAGITYHLNPELEVDIPAGGFGGRIEGTEEADNALGFMVAVDYVVNAHVEIGVRGTFVDYEFDAEEVDGNGFGAYLTYRFGDD